MYSGLELQRLIRSFKTTLDVVKIGECNKHNFPFNFIKCIHKVKTYTRCAVQLRNKHYSKIDCLKISKGL